MIWALPDGTVAKNSAEMRRLCDERGLDWSYFRRREQKGLARRPEGPRTVRLPPDWRARLDSVFGANAVIEFSKDIPEHRPAIIVASNSTDTAWWHHLAKASTALCLVRGRINYVDVDIGKILKGNPRGTIIFLFADDSAAIRRFKIALQPYGYVGCPYKGTP